MNPFVAEFDRLEADARPYARSFEVRLRRFLTAYMPALLTALIAAHNNLTWGLILSLGLSVAVTVAGEVDPSVPWSTFAMLLNNARWRKPSTPPPTGTRT